MPSSEGDGRPALISRVLVEISFEPRNAVCSHVCGFRNTWSLDATFRASVAAFYYGLTVHAVFRRLGDSVKTRNSVPLIH